MDIQVLGPDGKPKTPVCDADGKLVVTGIAGGGGGSGDASAANQTTQIAQIGEVQASPTANTVLDRLKTLATLIGEVQANPTSNTLLDRIKGIATLLSGGLPTSLGSNGGLKVEANGAKSTATVSRVSASATAVTLLAANSNRRRFIIHNESAVKLTVKFGSSASAVDYSFPLYSGDTFESWDDWIYTGIVTGIWDSATGAAQVTEI